MKRASGLWPKITTFENLLLAYKKARRGKTSRPEVTQFSCHLEHELITLKNELIMGNYNPGKYRQFQIYDRKPRLISAAPFRDRVVHHAMMNIVEPELNKSFIYHSYACRKGKGVHAAVDRYQFWANRYHYVLKMDIASYFPSIDHNILKRQFAAKIKDASVLSLFDLLLEQGPDNSSGRQLEYFPGDDLLTPLERRKGIPIGNLTSQILANLYLNEMDHFIKQSLKTVPYLRYVDDFVLLSNNKKELHEWRIEIQQYLEKLRLFVHPRKANIMHVNKGVDILGYRVFPDFRLLRNDNGFRFSRRLKQFAKRYSQNKMDWVDFNPSVQSWIGHASQADTLGLRTEIFESTVFKRESGGM